LLALALFVLARDALRQAQAHPDTAAGLARLHAAFMRR
jgi:hypothetical protein